MDGSATCSIELVRQNNIRHCQNMSVLNTWNTLPRNNHRVMHGRLEILLVELQGRRYITLTLYKSRASPCWDYTRGGCVRDPSIRLLTFTALLRPELRHEIPVVRPSLRGKTNLTSLSIS